MHLVWTLFTECLRGCLEVLWTYAPPTQRTPVSIFWGPTAYQLGLVSFYRCWKVSWNNMSVSVKQTSHRPNQSYLYRNKKRRQTMTKKKSKQGSKRTPGPREFSSRVWGLMSETFRWPQPPVFFQKYCRTNGGRTAVQMGGVLQYKWEVYCRVSLSSKVRSQEARDTNGGRTAVQIGGVLPYFLDKL